MVRLTRIYTGGGDKGETSLGDGTRLPKHARRVEAYGTVDEANAVIGLARVALRALAGLVAAQTDEIDAILARIQNDLFDLGADLCTPEGGRRGDQALRITEPQVERLEREIDAVNATLAPLESFVLPGGTATAAQLHHARTVVRRAERVVTDLAEKEPVNLQAVVYLNRLSDLLFVLARRCNDSGARDVLWEPGANR